MKYVLIKIAQFPVVMLVLGLTGFLSWTFARFVWHTLVLERDAVALVCRLLHSFLQLFMYLLPVLTSSLPGVVCDCCGTCSRWKDVEELCPCHVQARAACVQRC